MSLKLAFRHELSHGFSNLGKVKLESYFIYLNIKEYIQEIFFETDMFIIRQLNCSNLVLKEYLMNENMKFQTYNQFFYSTLKNIFTVLF